MPGHQRCSQLGVVTRERVPDRCHRLVVGGQPACGPHVQLRHEVGLGAGEVVAQHLGEQVVEAVPVAADVERDDEQLLPLGLGEQGRGLRLPGDGDGQLGAEGVEDRGATQRPA